MSKKEGFSAYKFTNAMGAAKNVQLVIMDAMAAWEFRHKFRWFLSTNDYDRKKSFISEAFKLIKIETSKDMFTPLLTDAVISNHIGTGDEGQRLLNRLFDELLTVNEIDKTWCAERLTYSKNLGDKIAHTFLANSIPRLLSCDFLR
jgi:hypothetical protein